MFILPGRAVFTGLNYTASSTAVFKVRTPSRRPDLVWQAQRSSRYSTLRTLPHCQSVMFCLSGSRVALLRPVPRYTKRRGHDASLESSIQGWLISSCAPLLIALYDRLVGPTI